MRIAWRVKLWVEPLLYRTLLIRRTSHLTVTDCFPSCSLSTFMEIVSTEKASFLRDSVRNLVVDFLSTENIRAVLSTCKSVENIHVIVADSPSLYYAPPSLSMPLRHLYCDIQDFCDITSFELFRHSSFHRITHLELFTGSLISCSATTDIPVCGQALAALKYLRALIILHTPPAHLSVELEILSEDPRFVMMQLEYYEEDWEAGILTGDDYWARADEFIAKRSREIERESLVRMFPTRAHDYVLSRTQFFLGEEDEEE
ncbi:hypothetical protein C8R44DRAFT_978191 [Mycena epipterygia]|nr:hypothetical protein C8R44DRAFT_978191 [Mycena epipterygia]